MLSLVSCKKNCSLEYEIIDKKYVIPYYYGTNQILIETGELNYERYKRININQSEVPYIQEIIKNQIKDCKNATNFMIENICDYSVQIAGFYDKKKETKNIYLNLFYGNNWFNNFEDEPVPIYDSYGNLIRFYDVFDGGDHHFQAVINTKTNTIRVIHINGEA